MIGDKLSIWCEGDEVLVNVEGEDKVFVYGTKRRAFNALEKLFDTMYRKKAEVKEEE